MFFDKLVLPVIIHQSYYTVRNTGQLCSLNWAILLGKHLVSHLSC